MSDGSKAIAEIKKPELIYGATALMLEGDYAENCYAINPVTNEKIKIIKKLMKDIQTTFISINKNNKG